MVLKPSHWSKDLKEVTLVTARDGVFNFRMVGGSDRGEFPVISEVLPPDTRGVEYTGPQELTTQVSRQDKTRQGVVTYPHRETRYFGFLFGERIFEGFESGFHLKLGLLSTQVGSSAYLPKHFANASHKW